MEHSRNPQQPSQGASPSSTEHPLTPQEQIPLIVLHVDIDNAVTVSTRGMRMQKRWRDAYPLANTCAFVTKILPNNPQMQVEELEQQLQAFGNCAKVKRKTRKAGNPKTSSDQLESAIGALRERHRSLLRRFMLPPTVCMALGCEAPDLNRVLGCEAEAKLDSGSTGSDPLEACHGEDGAPILKCPSTLPLQLHRGYWSIAPSFLSLLFSLVRARRAFRLVFHTRRSSSSPVLKAFLREFNSLCEGKHPAFDGENRTKQVFLDGTHGSPDLRISDHAMGVMSVSTMQTASDGKCEQHCFTAQLPHTLVMPAAKRCYKGIDEVFAGLVYQELEEHKALCIVHRPMDFPCSSAEGHQLESVAGDSDRSFTVEESSARTDSTNDWVTAGAKTLEAQDNLSYTSPLTILVDGQDLTRFHVCLSSPGVQTVVDGIVFLHTLSPVDILSQQLIKLQPISGLENEGMEVCNPETLPSSGSVCRKGRIECGIVACHIAPSQWDFLASSDCLVAALANSEKKRLQLSTPNQLCSKEEVADNKIPTLHEEYKGSSEESINQDAISDRGNPFQGLSGIIGSQTLPTGKNTAQPLSDVVYLMETVVPVLYPALEAVIRDRPDDPLAYIAFYLLRHSTGYSRTACPLQNSGAV